MAAWTDLAAAYAATLAIHSTLLLGCAWCILRFTAIRPTPTVWRGLMLAACVTAGLGSGTLFGPAPRLMLPGASISLPIGAVQGALPKRVHLGFQGGAIVEADFAADGSQMGSAFRGRQHSSRAVQAVAAAWVLGVFAALLRIGGAWRRQRRTLRHRRAAPADACDRAARLARRAGIGREIRLTASDDLDVAVALGRREICVPARALAELPGDWLDALLAHELHHLKRADSWWLVVMEGARTLCWFQPLARAVLRAHRDAADARSDAWASSITSPIAMAQCLAAVAVWPMDRRAPLAAGAGSDRHALLARVTRLLEPEHESVGRGRLVFVAAMLGAAFVALYGPSLRPAPPHVALPMPADAILRVIEPR